MSIIALSEPLLMMSNVSRLVLDTILTAIPVERLATVALMAITTKLNAEMDSLLLDTCVFSFLNSHHNSWSWLCSNVHLWIVEQCIHP